MQKIFLDCIGSSSKAHTGTFLHRKKRRSTGWRASTTHTASTSTRHRHASSQHPAPTPAPTRTRHPAPAPLSTSTRHRPVLFEVITPYSCRYLGNYSLKQAPSKTSSYFAHYHPKQMHSHVKEPRRRTSFSTQANPLAAVLPTPNRR